MAFTYKEIMHYHGFLLPGGAAHGFKAMEVLLPVVSPEGPPERREVSVETAFIGRGARDAFEMVTRSLTEGRYVVNDLLERKERGILSPYVFKVSYRGRTAVAQVKDGHVLPEFRALVAKGSNRTPAEEERVVFLRQEMADRLMALPGPDVYELIEH